MSSTWSGSAGGNQAGGVGFRGANASAAAWLRALWAFAGGEGRSAALERYGTLTARILISQIFLISGIMKIVDWSGTEA